MRHRSSQVVVARLPSPRTTTPVKGNTRRKLSAASHQPSPLVVKTCFWYIACVKRIVGRCLCVAILAGACACAARGREVFIREGCVSCHRFRGTGIGQVSDLSQIATRRDAASLRRKITDPGADDPASRMPAFDRMTWFDLHSLVAFLRS